MAVGRIRNKGQITIPAEVREAARVDEGTVVEFTVTDTGILMEPKVQVLVDREDAWFYTPEWQKRHREAVEQVEGGKGELHESTGDFLDSLDRS
jgi:AbrB family looped-hinge helix DNA binding protein